MRGVGSLIFLFGSPRSVRLSKTGHQRALIRIDPLTPNHPSRIRDLVMLISHLSIDGHAKLACRLPVLDSGSLRKCGITEGHQLQRHCRQSSSASRWKGALSPASPRREASLKTCPR
jgi:hypothetical protein